MMSEKMTVDEKKTPILEPETSDASDATTENQKASSKDSGKFWWAIIGFFLPPVGLVLGIAWFKKRPKDSRNLGLGSLASLLVTLVIPWIILGHPPFPGL